MKTRLVATAVLMLTLVAAGCGDDSGPSGAFGPGAVGNDASPSGGVDGPEDLGELGDLGAAGDILEDLSDGSFDPGDLEDLMENAEDMAESFGGSGSGTVSINDETISFASEICFAGQGDFTIEGAGETADGTPVWVSIDQSTDSREDMEDFMSEEMLDTMFGDADTMTNASFDVEYGRAELFGSGDDTMPNFSAFSGVGSEDQLTMELSGNGASGSGEATDFNFVSGDFEERYPFTFEASCS
ncbi:MAG: hypothetical protein RIB98_08245 [Acidimicrobiales bacterium]